MLLTIGVPKGLIIEQDSLISRPHICGDIIRVRVFLERVFSFRRIPQWRRHRRFHSPHTSGSRSAHEKSRARSRCHHDRKLSQLLPYLTVVRSTVTVSIFYRVKSIGKTAIFFRLVYDSMNDKHMVYMSVALDYSTLVLNCIGFYSLRVFLVCLDNFYDVTFETYAEVCLRKIFLNVRRSVCSQQFLL